MKKATKAKRVSSMKRLVLTQQELAIAFDVSAQTIKRWVESGKLPPPHFNNPPRWISKSFRVWLENQAGISLDDEFRVELTTHEG